MTDELAAIEHDVVLSNGHRARIASAELADLDAVRSFYEKLDDMSNYYRFFGIRRRLPDGELRNIVDPAVDEHVTLLLTVNGQLAGIGELIVGPEDDEAEVAFAVADDHHREGIATLLLEQLVMIARRRGIITLTAVTLPGNADMLLVFRTVGLSEHSSLGDEGVVHISFDLTAPDDFAEQCAHRRLLALEHADATTM